MILGKDGSIVAQFGDDERAANETLMQRVMWRIEREERARDSSVNFLIQYFDALGHGLKIEDLPGEVMSAEDGSLNMEAFKASLIRHGLDAGLDPTQVIILGENFQELVDGVYQDTIRLYKGRNVWTVIEEVGEALFNRALRDGLVTEEEAKEWTKGWAQTSGFRLQDPDNPTMAEATEAVSQMFEAAFLARRKEMPDSPKLFGLMRMGSEYLRQALTRAKQLTEMRDSGQLSESAETFLAQALGIDEQIELNEKTLEGLELPAGSYSVSEKRVQVSGKEFGDGLSFSELRRKAMEFMRGLRGASFTNKETGHTLLIDRKGEREPVSGRRKAEELKALPALKQMIENARYLGSKPDSEGRTDILAWHYYRLPVDIEGEVYQVTIAARELKDGKRFYDSYILDEKSEPDAQAGTASSRKLGDPTSGASDSSRKINGGTTDVNYSVAPASYLSEVAAAMDAAQDGEAKRLIEEAVCDAHDFGHG